MYLTLNRFQDDGETTLGLLTLNDEFLCFTAEDTHRSEKIDGKTRIPNGIYPLGIRTEGGMNQKYSSKYSEFHKGMIWVRNVPNFEYIYFHIGNSAEDSKGCILVGNICESSDSPSVDASRVLDSRNCYTSIYEDLYQIASSGYGFLLVQGV